MKFVLAVVFAMLIGGILGHVGYLLDGGTYGPWWTASMILSFLQGMAWGAWATS